MITINLLPQNLRKAERKVVVSTFPYKAYLLCAVAFFIFLHISLFLLMAVKKVQIVSLRGNWGNMEPQLKGSVSIKTEIKDLETNVNSLKGFISRKINMTEFLSSLNTAVPKGLWLERLSFSGQSLLIQGSVVSLNQNEMTIIGKFLQDLKSSKIASSVFSKIELGSVQRRTIKAYDVVDFVLSGELKK